MNIDLVVEKAVALIEESGVEDFSTRRLAARLGISAMTLYNYYENRGAILKGALYKGARLLWEGLDAEVSAWRSRGGSPLGSYRILADHLLAFAVARPKLCSFIITGSAGIDWTADDSLVEQILSGYKDSPPLRSEQLRRDVYLYEVLAFAMALKVISGGETAERYRDLLAESYELLLARHERAAAA